MQYQTFPFARLFYYSIIDYRAVVIMSALIGRCGPAAIVLTVTFCEGGTLVRTSCVKGKIGGFKMLEQVFIYLSLHG